MAETEKKPIGTILEDRPPVLENDIRNLRHDQPGEWNKILRDKPGVKLVDADVKQSARTRRLTGPEDGPTRQDTRNIRHEKDGQWERHVETLRKERGYDKEPVKTAPDGFEEEETEAKQEETEKPKKGRAPRKKKAEQK